MITTILATVAVIVVLVGPLMAFGYLAIRFGVDSRPDIGDRDRRPWLWRGPLD